MISVSPLVLRHSFSAARNRAADKVDVAQLDATFKQVQDKLNELIVALGETTRDDDTLKDQVLEPRHFHPEVYREITAIVNGTSQGAQSA